ncbi:hypothetical protein SAMN02745218_02885 [Desulfofundulus australicus DSM 11792]|uniref:Uncharacterized protein n=1 Tax=Desulfofundulus australicus DSM 11792 TaxID=1121425 RepID=A0A1M5DQ99_9FIRM|nr:hypothetical protein [Desulfofundulus australicus]SHF69167.1 hypothetical protein SAMN02745218_02885 [Desulfofundulus australicus DSM 11792]
MRVVWEKTKPNSKRRYAYFRHSYWEKGKVKPLNVYLGKTLEEAERRLEQEMLNGFGRGWVLTADEKAKLIRQLRELAPPEALEPTPDWRKQVAIRAVRRLVERYKARPDIAEPLQKALEAIEAGGQVNHLQEKIPRPWRAIMEV